MSINVNEHETGHAEKGDEDILIPNFVEKRYESMHVGPPKPGFQGHSDF